MLYYLNAVLPVEKGGVIIQVNGVYWQTPVINTILYNAKCQRTRIQYENGATTSYTCDPDTFRVTEIYTTATTYDALGRPMSITAPDNSLTVYTYQESGMLYSLQSLHVHSLSTPVVNTIQYNAKGQRTKIQYANGATTTYTYDPDTFRVTEIRTTRKAAPSILQDLLYYYDPIGNITQQLDHAQQTVYFHNAIASPVNNYTYDAIYRLAITSGREHAGNNGAPTWSDSTRSGISPVPVSAADTTKMRNYTDYYTYDETGNIQTIRHTVTGATGGWTRKFVIDGPTNQMLSCSIGSNNPVLEKYTYDLRGNINGGMNHLKSLTYNEVNQLQTVQITATMTAYYQYNLSGTRVRKVIIDTGSGITTVRKYVGEWEHYNQLTSGTSTLQRETLNLMDDRARVALIDTPTLQPSGGTEVQLLRYQFSNHLSTATLELDNKANVISYEEYYAYGSTSFQCGVSGAEVSLKRYRFTGKEKDEYTGFYYHGARYYAPWLVRWIASDPAQDSMPVWSPYNYGFCNPITWEDSSGSTPDQSAPPPPSGGDSGSGDNKGSNDNKGSGDSKGDGKGGDGNSGGGGGSGSGGNSDKKEIDAYIDKATSKLPDNSPIWANISKAEFVSGLKALAENGSTLNQGNTGFCGPSSVLAAAFADNPMGMIDAMVGLYATGIFSYNNGNGGLELKASDSIKNYVGSKDFENNVIQSPFAEKDMSKTEGMLLFTVADQFKGIINLGSGGFDPGKIEGRWAGSDFRKEISFARAMGYNVEAHGSNIELIHPDRINAIQEALSSGGHVIVFENPTVFENNGKASMLQHGEHYITVTGIDKNKGGGYTVHFTDYGVKNHDATMSSQNFIRGIFGYMILKNR